MFVFSSPLTRESLRARLYPFGRLRTSLAYQGATRINWQAFFLEQERRQASASLLSVRRVTMNPVLSVERIK